MNANANVDAALSRAVDAGNETDIRGVADKMSALSGKAPHASSVRGQASLVPVRS